MRPDPQVLRENVVSKTPRRARKGVPGPKTIPKAIRMPEDLWLTAESIARKQKIDTSTYIRNCVRLCSALPASDARVAGDGDREWESFANDITFVMEKALLESSARSTDLRDLIKARLNTIDSRLEAIEATIKLIAE